MAIADNRLSAAQLRILDWLAAGDGKRWLIRSNVDGSCYFDGRTVATKAINGMKYRGLIRLVEVKRGERRPDGELQTLVDATGWVYTGMTYDKA